MLGHEHLLHPSDGRERPEAKASAFSETFRGAVSQGHVLIWRVQKTNT